MDINLAFSTILYQHRKALGYTQEFVAEHCGFSSRQYQSLEMGRSLPSFLNAIRLSILLEFSLDEFKNEVTFHAVSV